MNNSTIAALTPAAARLLLACLYTRHNANYEEIVAQSGIADCQTLITAKEQLRRLGFITVRPEGGEQLALPKHWSLEEEQNVGPIPMEL